MSHILEIGKGMAPMALDADGLASGMAFLNGELEKRDPRLLEPLTSVTWMRDIVSDVGGGYVDFTSNYFVDYGTTGPNEYGIIGGETNNLPIIQANVSKDVYPVFTFGNVIRVPFLDQQRMQQVGRSLDQIFDDGLRLNYNKMLDQNVYFGFETLGQTGLVNNPDVSASLAPATGTGSARTWASKTPQQIMTEINDVLTAAWAAGNYDLTSMPNQILLPPAVFADLNNRLVSTAGSISLLEYLMRYNIAAANGVELKIVSCRQCIGQGLPLSTGGDNTNRAVFYVNKEDRVSFDIPVPLTRALTQPSVDQMAFLTAYVGQVGVVKFKYFQCVRYFDGI